MFKKVMITTVMICMGIGIHAQSTGTITGVIRDRDTNQPLVGANVMLEETYFGAATDGQPYVLT